MKKVTLIGMILVQCFAVNVVSAESFSKSSKVISIEATVSEPTCHVFPHQVAQQVLAMAMNQAMEQAWVNCGEKFFNSSSVEMATVSGGCGAVVAQVKGFCLKPE